MAITLAQAELNTTEDYDASVINTFRKSNAFLDILPFHQAVNPAGGGATIRYGYRRQITQRPAEFRPIGKEYTPGFVETADFSVTLAELGGAYEVDRRIAHLGPAASDEVTLQTENLIAAASAKFNDASINGDIAVDEHGFDGLDKALTGSTTELDGGLLDLTTFTSAETAMTTVDAIDELTSELDGPATCIIANKYVLLKLRSAGRMANIFTESPLTGLGDDTGIQVFRQQFGNVLLIDPGTVDGSNDLIIPIDEEGRSDIYAIRTGLSGFHGVTTVGGNIVKTIFPDFSTAGATKRGEVFLENVGVALKSTKSASVLRGVRIR